MVGSPFLSIESDFSDSDLPASPPVYIRVRHLSPSVVLHSSHSMGLGLLLSDWPEYHAVLPGQAVFGCGVSCEL